MRVLVTGAFGWTAISIIQALKQVGHQVTAFDLTTAICSDEIRPLLSRIMTGDVANFNHVYQAVQSTDAIIHLAVATGQDDYRSPDIPFAVNVKGTYHVLEAARRCKVKKTVLLSSAAVHLNHSEGERISALTDWKSSREEDHLYDLTKRLQEEIAKDFCKTYRMSVVVLRAGHIVDGKAGLDRKGRPLSALEYARGGWVCRYDVAEACLRALELSTVGYSAFHVIGAEQARAHFDIERTEKELGLIFTARFEDYQHEVRIRMMGRWLKSG